MPDELPESIKQCDKAFADCRAALSGPGAVAAVLEMLEVLRDVADIELPTCWSCCGSGLDERGDRCCWCGGEGINLDDDHADHVINETYLLPSIIKGARTIIAKMKGVSYEEMWLNNDEDEEE